MIKDMFNKAAAANDNGPSTGAHAAVSNFAQTLRKMRKRALGNGANDNGPNPDRELLRAAEHGELAKVKHWLKMGANIDARHTNNDTPLIIAAREGYEEVVKYLVRRKKGGSDLSLSNNEGQTALHVAAHTRATPIAVFLVEAGAPTAGRDREGATTAFYAAQTGDGRLIDAIAAAKGDIDTPNAGQVTPLIQSIRFAQGEAAAALILQGAKLDARDAEGMTALMHAIATENSGLAVALIGKHANIELKNNQGKTALDFAEQTGHRDIIEALGEEARRLQTERFGAFHTGTKTEIPVMRRLSLKKPEVKR